MKPRAALTVTVFLLVVAGFLSSLSPGSTSNRQDETIQEIAKITIPLLLNSEPGAVIGARSNTVTRVIDGDTIELADGRKIRYTGIDTPETKHPSQKAECFGKEATNKNTELILNKSVRLEADVQDTDRYGRLLRYVYIDDIMINDELIKQGYATQMTIPPNVKHAELFQKSEQHARENKLGLWASCTN